MLVETLSLQRLVLALGSQKMQDLLQILEKYHEVSILPVNFHTYLTCKYSHLVSQVPVILLCRSS